MPGGARRPGEDHPQRAAPGAPWRIPSFVGSFLTAAAAVTVWFVISASTGERRQVERDCRVGSPPVPAPPTARGFVGRETASGAVPATAALPQDLASKRRVDGARWRTPTRRAPLAPPARASARRRQRRRPPARRPRTAAAGRSGARGEAIVSSNPQAVADWRRRPAVGDGGGTAKRRAPESADVVCSVAVAVVCWLVGPGGSCCCQPTTARGTAAFPEAFRWAVRATDDRPRFVTTADGGIRATNGGQLWARAPER